MNKLAYVDAEDPYESGNADEQGLFAKLRSRPVDIGFAVGDTFYFYYEGIYDGGCSSSVNHAMLAVGYGFEDGEGYVIVKNSWGTDWGEDGYLYIAITDGVGVCGINQ